MVSRWTARFLQAARRRFRPAPQPREILWEGDFARWEDASARASGYESPLILEKSYIYFQDIIDHLTQVSQSLDSFREMISNLSDLYLSNNDVQMNDVMKRLTVVATIFIPLTFLVGLYGMNFKYFPELQWQYGYLYLWIFMIIITSGMLIYLKKRKRF